MRVLVVGGGGREDAIAWRLSQDEGVTVATCPGNAGSARWGENLTGSPEDAAAQWKPDLVVVGPEIPLADGLADRLRSVGFPVFGPGAEGARLESSKAHAKEIMARAGVPTARAQTVHDAAAARRIVAEWGTPIVLKADGLAAGKGVVVARTPAEAEDAIVGLFEESRFGAAGATAVIEEFMAGREASILAITDGERFLLLPSAEDHKAVFDGDRGPNTGGMGVISPTPVVTHAVRAKVEERILAPMLPHLQAIGYRGVLYVGLMVSGDGPSADPRVVEFNVRFGDPEAQAVLPRIEGPFAATLLATAEGQLDPQSLTVKPGATACVILAAPGYPGAFPRDLPIRGWQDAAAGELGARVFVSGAALKNGELVTTGGRVLSIVGEGDTMEEAREAAYAACEHVGFEGMHYRRDIGMRK